MEIRGLQESIGTVNDPRRSWGNLRHKLEDILIIGLCLIICGGEDYTDMEEFGREREGWLGKFLELPNGIPDSDTFRRVFERVNPAELSLWLNDWLETESVAGGRLVNIDGKTIRGSGNRKHGAFHVVSAWVGKNSITLGELATEEKSNEITAVPKLIKLLDIKGDIVTADAMSCQKDIAGAIRDKNADYVLALKGNQPTMETDVKEYFNWLERDRPRNERFEVWTSPPEKDHGRLEVREATTISAAWYAYKDEWRDLRSFIQVRSFVTEKEVETVSTRYYISSLDVSANRFSEIIRGHWSIENNLHWCLDTVFGEDSARAKKDNSPLNLNVLRKLSLSLLKLTDMGKRVSLKKKMFKSALNPDRLLSVLLRK
jgi:predicted transposase YbfD/YdcC